MALRRASIASLIVSAPPQVAADVIQHIEVGTYEGRLRNGKSLPLGESRQRWSFVICGVQFVGRQRCGPGSLLGRQIAFGLKPIR
jgi:hypothetical protein